MNWVVKLVTRCALFRVDRFLAINVGLWKKFCGACSMREMSKLRSLNLRYLSPKRLSPKRLRQRSLNPRRLSPKRSKWRNCNDSAGVAIKNCR